MKRTDRSSNIELLRIVAMYMIIVHHGITHSGIMGNCSVVNDQIAGVLVIGGKLGVNVFVIISSYFLIDQKFRSRGIFRIWSQSLLYGILIWTLCVIFKIGNTPITALFRACFPVVGELNWYVTTFIMFLILVPIMRCFVDNATKRALFGRVCILMVAFCFIPTIMLTDIFGNNLIWFCCIFFIVAYLKRYCTLFNRSGWKIVGIFSFFAIVLMDSALKVGGYFFPRLSSKTLFFANQVNNLFLVLLAFSLFYLFLSMDIGTSSIINSASACTFGIFLIHTVAPIKKDWLWIVCNIRKYTFSSYFVFYLLGLLLLVFTVCGVIDICLRKMLLERIWGIEFINSWLAKLDKNVNECFYVKNPR